jgi:hypothetical protein
MNARQNQVLRRHSETIHLRDGTGVSTVGQVQAAKVQKPAMPRQEVGYIVNLIVIELSVYASKDWLKPQLTVTENIIMDARIGIKGIPSFHTRFCTEAFDRTVE